MFLLLLFNKLLASETLRGNTIENRRYLFIYIFGRTYVILYFDPRVFLFAPCSTLSQASLNRILRFSDHYPYHLRN